MSTEAPAPESHRFREKLIAVFKIGKWFPKKSGKRSCDKKRSSNRAKTDATVSQKKARNDHKKSGDERLCRTNVKEAAQVQHPQQEEQPRITSITSTTPVVTRAKIANYEPPKQYTSRRIGSTSVLSSRSHSGPIPTQPMRNYSVARSRQLSGTQSVPVSGELGKAGAPKVVRSTSKSFSKLRDQYVKAMLKLGDMADSVAIGNSVNFESHVFESDVIRRRSQAESEIMDYYFNSSIQPDEWKNAQMGSTVIRNGTIAV